MRGTNRPGAAMAQTVDDNEAKPKGRPAHPAVGADENYPFETIPGDFDFAKHRRLNRKDFKDEAFFWDYKVSEAEWNVKRFKKQAEDARKFGSKEEKQKAKRFLRMQEQMAALQKELESQGVDIENLLGTSED